MQPGAVGDVGDSPLGLFPGHPLMLGFAPGRQSAAPARGLAGQGKQEHIDLPATSPELDPENHGVCSRIVTNKSVNSN